MISPGLQTYILCLFHMKRSDIQERVGKNMFIMNGDQSCIASRSRWKKGPAALWYTMNKYSSDVLVLTRETVVAAAYGIASTNSVSNMYQYTEYHVIQIRDIQTRLIFLLLVRMVVIMPRDLSHGLVISHATKFVAQTSGFILHWYTYCQTSFWEWVLGRHLSWDEQAWTPA